jgi:hypothetical protein
MTRSEIAEQGLAQGSGFGVRASARQQPFRAAWSSICCRCARRSGLVKVVALSSRLASVKLRRAICAGRRPDFSHVHQNGTSDSAPSSWSRWDTVDATASTRRAVRRPDRWPMQQLRTPATPSQGVRLDRGGAVDLGKDRQRPSRRELATRRADDEASTWEVPMAHTARGSVYKRCGCRDAVTGKRTGRGVGCSGGPGTEAGI